MTALSDRFRSHLGTLVIPPGVGLVAVSGGADSLALLHLLVDHADIHRLRLVVAHVDHGIVPESGKVAQRTAALATRLGLPYETVRLELGHGASETRARRARWDWLYTTLEKLVGPRGAGVILTAHHRDDQVETVLMRVLGGSGPAGLTGVTTESGPRGQEGQVGIVRPLLPFSRQEIREWVAARGLDVWDDPSNRDPRHLRGWLRLEVLPLLRRRFPDLDQRILAVASQAGLDRAAWDAVLDALPLLPRRETGGVSVASAPLRVYDTMLALALLMALARRAGCVIGPRRASLIWRIVDRGRSGARVELGDGWIAEVRFDRLALVRQAPADNWRVAISEARGRARVGRWHIGWAPGKAPDRLPRADWTTWLSPGEYEVRPWRPGDRIRPLGGRGGRLVVRCMQECKVGRGDRSSWPVVTQGQTVVWVPGVSRAEAAVPDEGTEAWRIDVERE